MSATLLIDEEARSLIRKLESTHGSILFYQSFGCCDGSVPICYARKDFTLGSNDICLASSEGIELWTHQNQAPLYENATFHLSATEGAGNEYSLEYDYNARFILL